MFRRLLTPQKLQIAASHSYATVVPLLSTSGPPLGLLRMVNASEIAEAYDPLDRQHSNYAITLGPLDLSASYGVASGTLRLTRWTSKASGFKVVHVDHPGPLVNGYLTVATEIFNDSGVPHTLEHLVFLGSEQFPYKGVLDSLANRAFAQGTNAWTDTTNTSYTVTTAGQEGFLALLPVYLDHILYPTITDAGFTTEVYHVNGEGQESGVVFSEMQGRENLSADLMDLRTQRMIYGKESGYRSETGGLMEALRLLSADEIRRYHASTYLPHNMLLLVTGRIETAALLEVLETRVEPRIRAHQQDHGERPPGWLRPWVETASAKPPEIFTRSVVVEFPETDESSGEWQCTWLGPDSQDFDTLVAVSLVGTYLYDSPVSPLYRDLIEIDEPYCTEIWLEVTGRSTTTLSMSAASVPSEHLSSMRERVMRVIQGVVHEGIDIQRMQDIIERDRLKLLSSVERNTPDLLAQVVIGDFLFGPMDGSSLAKAVNATARYQKLKNWTAQEWASVLKSWFLDKPCLTVLGLPSPEMAKSLKSEVGKRENDRRKQLGPDGLKELGQALIRARLENDRKIPDTVLTDFPIPDLRRIEWIKVQTARPKGLSPQLSYDARDSALVEHLATDSTELPYFVQFDHVPSSFVTISLHAFPRLSSELLTLLPLWLESFFSLPIITCHNSVLSFDDVVRLLDRETVDYCIESGQPLEEGVRIDIKVPLSRYSRAIELLRDLLWHSVFDVSRLRVVAARMNQSLPAEKRDGDDIVSAAFEYWTSDRSQALLLGNNLISRIENIPALVRRLRDEPASVVVALEKLSATVVTDPSRIRIAVRGDILSLPQPVKMFEDHFEKICTVRLSPIPYAKDVLSEVGKRPSRMAVIYSLASIESSYASFVCRGIQQYNDPARPALIVAMAVMNGLESFLWRHVRGAGLAYGAHIRADVDGGFVYYNVYKSPDAAKAFVAAKQIVLELAEGNLYIDNSTLEAAKSSLAYTFASQEATIGAAAASSFSNQVLYGVSRDYAREMLVRINEVTREDVLRSIRTFVLPAFDPTTSIAVVSSGPSKVQDIGAQLKHLGYEVDMRTLDGADDKADEKEDSSEWENISDASGSEI